MQALIQGPARGLGPASTVIAAQVSHRRPPVSSPALPFPQESRAAGDPALFSEQDRLADRKVHTDAKAAATDSEPLRNAILAKWGVNGAPTIDQLLADGIAEFRVQAADRVLGWISDLFSRPRLIIQCAATLHRCQVQIRTGEGANGDSMPPKILATNERDSICVLTTIYIAC